MPGKGDITNYNLRFMAEVLGMDHLHWGYFPAERPAAETLSLAALKEAQEEYTSHLLGYIPAGVRTILDVGCGLGTVAHILQSRGYRVHCLSNNTYQEKIIAARYPELPFTRSRFEDSLCTERFDLILMSESAQYLDWPRALAKAGESLNPGGYLLVSDYFRLSDDPYYHTCQIRQHFTGLTATSFRLLREEDITGLVLPTLDYGRFCFTRYIQPAANLAAEVLEVKIPRFVRFLARLCLRKQLEGIRRYLWVKMPRKFDREMFKEKMCYLIQLWEMV